MNRSTATSVLISLALLLGSVSTAAVNSAVTQVNYSQDANYGLSWNYVNQSSISASNVQSLNLKWLFPIPSAPPPYSGKEGTCCTPIIENGVAYILTNYHHIYALSTTTGSVIWDHQIYPSQNASYLQSYQICAAAGYPGICGPPGHYHNMNFFYSTHTLGQPLIWVMSDNYTLYAWNANTGHLVLEYQVPIPAHGQDGNLGYYDTLTPAVFLDDQRQILVVGTSVSEGTDAGRGFLIGISVSTTSPQVVWMTPITPPQDGSDPNWDLQQVQSMVGAWIFNGTGAVNLKTLPSSVLNATLYDDWGFAKYSNSTNSFAGAGIGWGGPWAEDSSTGNLFVGTAEAAPDWNATYRPGPNLWADSILSVDVTTGKINWAFQTTPHDLWDFDCSWSSIFTGSMVIKACKNAYIYGLNPTNGALEWYFVSPTFDRTNSKILNPLNPADMSKAYECAPQSSPCPVSSPPTEMDPAYDPSTGLVYYAPSGDYGPSCQVIGPVAPSPGVPLGTWGINLLASPKSCGGGLATAGGTVSQIYALNANTGHLVWNFSLPVSYRGGFTITNGVLFAPASNGILYELNAANGSLIQSRLLGVPLITQPAIGTDADGNMVLIQPIGTDTISGVLPGDVVALELPPTSTVVQQTAPTGINPIFFYAAVVIAVILAIATLIFGTMSRRRGPKVPPSSN